MARQQQKGSVGGKDLHRRKCRSLYATLLEINGDRRLLSSLHIREFFETARCDDVFDFAPERRELAERVNTLDPTRLERVLRFDEAAEDEAVAAQALLHYTLPHRDRLLAAVDWPTRLHYHAVAPLERAAAKLGFGAAGSAGVRAAHSSSRHISERRTAAAAAAAASASAAVAAGAKLPVAVSSII